MYDPINNKFIDKKAGPFSPKRYAVSPFNVRINAVLSVLTELQIEASNSTSLTLNPEVAHSLGCAVTSVQIALDAITNPDTPPQVPTPEPALPNEEPPIKGMTVRYVNPLPPNAPPPNEEHTWLRIEALNAAKHCTTDLKELLTIAEDIHEWLTGKKAIDTI